jgi:hypothetical protein
MLLFAFSLEAEVEKYGAYLGIASFFGLAVLSLLYFSQARELKRLREWAGRAPERARELEQRVVAQATATVARRPAAPAAPGAKMAPPRRLAEMPAPPPATAGAVAAAAAEESDGGATQVADPAADPETNGSVPPAPGAAVPEPAAAPPGNGAKPAEGEEAEAAEPQEPVADPNETHEFDAEEAAAATGAGEDAEARDETAEPDEESGEHEAPAAPATAAGAAGAAAAATGATAGAAAGTAVPTGAAAGASAAGPETDPSVPRLTPAQRVGAAPRPEPLPLRQSQPSATPAGRRPTAKPAARRPAPEREGEGRSAGTIALLVGLAVLLLGGAAFGASQLFGGDDNSPQPNQAAPPPTQTATTDGGEANATTPASETKVAVLNGTTFNGLAGNLADRITQEGGYQRGITETNVRDQTLQESTVFYTDGFRRQARDVAKLLAIPTVQPIDEETAALAQDANVVVLAGADQAP